MANTAESFSMTRKSSIITKTIITIAVILFFSSCNGQEIIDNFKAKAVNNVDFNVLKLKIPKPIGTNKEASIGIGIQDREGNIWFGSYGEGVFCFNGSCFVQYTMNEGLNSNTTYSIVEDKAGNIWVGTNKGLNRFNGKKFEKKSIELKSSYSSHLNLTMKTNSTRENSVWSMMVDRKGLLWLGTDDGVYCYNGKYFTRFLDNKFLLNKDSLLLRAIFSIIETRDGSIWFTACQSEGVSQLKGSTLLNIIPYKDIGRTDKVIEDRNGNLWFASVFKGVGFFDGKKFRRNVFNELATNGPSNIVEDKDGNIWFDTQKGLACYNGKKLKIFTENDGVQAKKMIPVMLDNNGRLWFSTKGMGLYQYYQGKFIVCSE